MKLGTIILPISDDQYYLMKYILLQASVFICDDNSKIIVVLKNHDSSLVLPF